MRRSTALGAATVMGALMLFSQAAGAHLAQHGDADDVGHRLDVRQTNLEKVPMGEYRGLKFIVRTHDRFEEMDLNQGGIRVNVDSRGDGEMDFYLLVDLYEGSYPYCSLYDRDGFSEHAATVEIGRRYASCALPRYALRPTKDLRWNVRTEQSDEVDRAPSSGWYDH